jgi:hypothetical protein
MTVLLGGWSGSGTASMGWTTYPNNNKITVFEIAT